MLFLDTEFSEFGGQLISIALVSDKGGEFYAVRHLPSKMHPWVRENVVPVLVKDPEDDHVIAAQLLQFLRVHPCEKIVADWPEDFTHLLGLLCSPGGYRASIDLEMSLITSGDFESAIPHNALSDARALMKWYNEQPRYAGL